jgi:hypothetical protein
MMRVRTSSIGLTTAATIAAVTVLMTGSAVAGPHIERFTKAEPQVPYRLSTAPVDRLLSAFNREQSAPLPAPVPRAAVTTLSAAIPKLPPVSAANPLEGKPLRYLIGTDIPDLGREGEITEVSYSTIKPTARGISIKCCSALLAATLALGNATSGDRIPYSQSPDSA